MGKTTKESRARQKVHNKLPARQFTGPFWWQSMSGTGTGGTPDHYYEGPDGTLWIEWKWTDAKNPQGPPKPTELQESWLVRKHKNGGQVAVIEACSIGFRIYPELTWLDSKAIQPIDSLQCALWILLLTYSEGLLR